MPTAVLMAPRRPRFGWFMVGAIVTVAAVALAAGRFGDLLPSLSNPFGVEEVDRSQPPLLESLVDLARYEAASANFQVIVDVERDTRFVPSVIKGERTVFVASGDVGATVDFSALDERAVTVSDDRRSATVVLPAPELADPRVDPLRSRVVSRERGLLDRIGGVFADTPTSERTLLLVAEAKMRAAAAESDLLDRAEGNTRTMVETLLRSLGFTTVTVTFAPRPT
jgi:hypothetical protein